MTNQTKGRRKKKTSIIRAREIASDDKSNKRKKEEGIPAAQCSGVVTGTAAKGVVSLSAHLLSCCSSKT